MKKLFFLAVLLYAGFSAFSQNVGIGTTAPKARLHVTDSSVLFSSAGDISPSYNPNPPVSGAGRRMMWIPELAAFRAGYAIGTEWDKDSIGIYSVAMGFHTKASGRVSTSFGVSTTASEFASTSFGALTSASGDYSLATGYSTVASGSSSLATGYQTTASGNYSLATGFQTTASGNYSLATGFQTTASGLYSTAIGKEVNINGHQGAFSIGDSDPNNEGVTISGVPDQFVARFWNGYYLMTSGNNVRSGVAISHNGNAWVSICDKNLKENFEPLNGEEVLRKIAGIRFSSWNYKQQDPQQYRHYGIMAQHFYNAFGKDKYGTIGNDTTVNPIDMIGVDMAAIQALEKRTQKIEQLQKENSALKNQLTEIAAELKALRKETAYLMNLQNKQQKNMVAKK